MTACAVAALTVYDMVKGIERGVVLEQIVLLEKTRRAQRLAARGGRQGRGPMRAAIITISTSQAGGAGQRRERRRGWRALAERLGREIARARS